MTTTIDTSNGLIILNGGGVTLPTSVTSVTPAAGMLRYNATTDSIEWYGGSGLSAEWYPVSGPIFNKMTTITTNTTLVNTDVGNFIECNNSSPITLTLPGASSMRGMTGFTFHSKNTIVTLLCAGSDTFGSGLTTFDIVKGDHLTIVSDGSATWYGVSRLNSIASVVPYVFESVGTGIVAAGTSQGTATLITDKYSSVSTVPTGTGVVLPTFVNIGVGVTLTILNDGANPLLIYPQSGASIDSLSVNAPFTLAVGGRINLICISSVLWETNQGVNNIPNNTILSNISGGSSLPLANSLSSTMDYSFSNAQGSVLYRGSTNWLALAPGTPNQFLQTQGIGATPQWANVISSIDTGTGLSGGPITTTGTISLSVIGNNTFLGNTSGASAAPVAITLTEYLDSVVGSTAQGNILYRGATVWSALAPGTNGQLLQTGGAAANPQWSNSTITPNAGDSSTAIATTSFVNNVIGGNTTIATTGGSTTLTAAQYGAGLIIVTGALTSNATLVVPNTGKWTVSNRTTNAFTVTVQTLSGTGVVVGQGYNSEIVADGANCISGVTSAVTLPSIANNDLLGNISGSTAAATAISLTALIDSALGSTQGDILYRNSTAWVVLAPGTSGQLLQTSGAAANPVWAGTTTTPAAGDSSTAIATTAFVDGLVGSNASVATTGGSTTLTAAEYGVGLIIVTGTLASNATLVVPNTGKWTVSNRTTGAFTVTVKTSAGTGVVIAQNANETVVADGTNVILADTITSSAVTTALGYTPVATNTHFTDLAFYGINTGATAGRLTTDGNVATTTNVGALADSSAQIFDIELLAYDLTTPAAVTFSVSGGLATRGVGASTVVISGTPTFTAGTTTAGAPTISTIPTVTADVTNGGYNIEFTPPTGNTDTWHITARMRVTIAS